MKWINSDAVLPKLVAMAEASESSALKAVSDDAGGEVAREAMKAIAGTLRAVIKVLGDHETSDVVPIQGIAEFLAGYCVPPEYLDRQSDTKPMVRVLTLNERIEMWAEWIRKQNWEGTR